MMDCLLIADLTSSFLPAMADSLGELANWLPLAQAETAATAPELAEEAEGISYKQITVLGIALAVLILPFVIGGYLSKMFKMPQHSTRFGFILLALTASSVVLISKLPKLGVDLRGGTILVYEIDPGKNKNEDGQAKIKSSDLIEPLSRRINPSGTLEIVIRPYGESQIEIIIPEVDQREVDRIKTIIANVGFLRFAILANRADHQQQIDLALQQAESPQQVIRTQKEVLDASGTEVAMWATVDQEASAKGKVKPFRVSMANAIIRNPLTGQFLTIPDEYASDETKQAAWVASQGLERIETLMIIDQKTDVRGEDLAFAASVFDQNGAPAVSFNLTDAGSGKFFTLTTVNAPKGQRQRQLGILMDDALLSAPNILSPIRTQGQITGNFTREEVDSLVRILKAGQLPAALTKQPIAENLIDATLGAETIRKGVIAIVTSLILVLVFILIYYRFAGFVACVALVLNLAMILATMVLINQPLTLPGLAGLVLTVGMSVDANVLIFERIREELKKGAASRMAVRNGFAKATVTIVDANLTTLITAIVLYAIGTDQIRGFAVTLILGILFSMFTAIYMSRTFFDFAERHGFLSLGMSDTVNSIRHKLSGEGNLDFVGMGRLSLMVSAVLIAVGVGSLFVRGGGIFDIDFAGGSSVQFRLDKPTPSDDVRKIVESGMVDDEGKKIQYTVNAVTIAGIPDNTVYKVDSAFPNVKELQDAIVGIFESNADVGLVTYKVDVGSGTTEQSSVFRNNGTMLTAMRAQDEAPQDAEETVSTDDTDSSGDSADEATAKKQTHQLKKLKHRILPRRLLQFPVSQMHRERPMVRPPSALRSFGKQLSQSASAASPLVRRSPKAR